ncbi:MAG TPA: CbbX protein, partial [Acetobacteraceae bacterium]|nr:CbbX protein [Acetobacteraceae bacterium]
ASRIAHHIDFPDYSEDELYSISELMLEKMHYRLAEDAVPVFRDYIARRMVQPRFSNARSIRNALDRARLRQANRLFAARGKPFPRSALEMIEADDIRQSRVFAQLGGNTA